MGARTGTVILTGLLAAAAAVACGSDPASDDSGGYRIQIQVETPDGCVEFIGATPAGNTARRIFIMDELPSQQDPPYDTVTVLLRLLSEG